jgi:N utilization substance protein B
MAKVDLTILRMATYEMLFCPDIPLNVSMDEAIEIGKRYGSDDSATFINGVLDQVAQASGVK